MPGSYGTIIDRTRRSFRTVSAMTREARRSYQRFIGWQYIVDIVAYRAIRLFPRVANGSHERNLNLRGGGSISYRRNRGDIQGIREVFLDEILPLAI